MRPDELPGMQNTRTFTAIYRGLVATFVVLSLVSGFLLSDIIRTGPVIDTDLRALLPDTGDNALSHHAETRLLNRLGNTIILLIGATTPETATKAADFGNAWLHSHTSLRVDPDSPLSHDPERLIQQMKNHRFHLLTPEQRQLLENNTVEVLVNKGWASVLGPQSWARITSTQEDPLALFDGFVERLSQTTGTANVTRQRGYPLFSTAQIPGWFFAPLYIDTGEQAFQLDAQANTVAALARLQEELEQRFPGIRALKSGVIFHAAEAAHRAQREVALIGLGSLLGIVVLFVVAFRSLTPLAMSLASVFFGCVIAFSLVHYLYSGLHIITLVFGAALIGVSVDYSLHYFTKRFSSATPGYRFASLRSIFPAICLGLITSVIGYGSLYQAPLPGLNQVALFSVTGLIGAWLFVVVVYPWLGIRDPKPLPVYLTRWALLPLHCWQGLGRRHLHPTALLVALSALGALGAWLTITTNDDIRVLHTPSTALLKEEKELKAIINSYAGNQLFIVTGPTEQRVLQNEEAFRPLLDELLESGAITGYQAISRLLPSIARQQKDYRLQKLKLYNGGDGVRPGPVPRFMEELGFDTATVEQLLHRFTVSEREYLIRENWPGLQASGLDLLWLGRIGDEFGTLILLQGIEDTAALAAAAARFDEVVFVDKVSELSRILEYQRRSAATMLALAYGVVIALLILRYRRLHAMLLALVPLVSTLLTITLLSSAGTPIGLFHLFAMFLILGLGMDYSIFVYESPATETASYTAILLSAITTSLSFGLLSLSSTPMVQFFGTMVLIGSCLNLILAPAVAHLSPGRRLRHHRAGVR